MRVFLDTNVLISGLTVRGLCSEVLEHTFNAHDLLICEPVLQEVKRVLADKFRLPATLIRDYIDLLKNEGQLITGESEVSAKIDDKDDRRILAFAIPARPDVFVTGDKELLKFTEIDGVPILSPRQFWFQLAGDEE